MGKRAIAATVAVAVYLGAAFFAASTVQADTTVLSRAGEWQAFGGTTDNGRPVCGVSWSGAGRYFGVKLFSGNDTFTVQMGKSTWKVTDGSKQKMVMRFDYNSPWEATGTGMHFGDGDAGLSFAVARKQLAQFMTEFRASNQLSVEFVGSDAAPWLVSLAGTNAMSNVFLRCVGNLQ